MTITILAAGAQAEIEGPPTSTTDELWIHPDLLVEVTGWQLKSEGLCKHDVCVPLTPAQRERIGDERVDAAGLWRDLGRPVLRDASGSTWMLGESAADRGRQLETLEAPDFTLPDIHGKLHSLSEQRGKKVLLATWASW